MGIDKGTQMRQLKSVNNLEAALTIENSEILANELYQLASERRAIEKREAKLKTFFKDLMGNDSVMRVGPFMMTMKDCMVTNLDRERLVTDMGEPFLQKYLVATQYKRFDILKDKVA